MVRRLAVAAGSGICQGGWQWHMCEYVNEEARRLAVVYVKEAKRLEMAYVSRCEGGGKEAGSGICVNMCWRWHICEYVKEARGW